MNAALLLMTSAWAAGADAVPPAPIVAAAPVMIGGGCGSCGGCGLGGDPCCAGYCPGTADPNPRARTGLLARLRSKFSLRRSNDCDSGCGAPTCGPTCGSACGSSCGSACGTPVFTGFTTAACEPACGSCDPCGHDRQGLLARLRARLRGRGAHECCGSVATIANSCCDSGCGYSATSYSGCALPLPHGATPVAPPPAAAPMPLPGETPKEAKPKTTGTAELIVPPLNPTVSAPPTLGVARSPF